MYYAILKAELTNRVSSASKIICRNKDGKECFTQDGHNKWRRLIESYQGVSVDNRKLSDNEVIRLVWSFQHISGSRQHGYSIKFE